MKVTVIKPAFFNGTLLPAGAEVEVPDTLKASWFVARESVEAKAARAPRAKQEPKALSQVTKDDGKSFTEVHADKTDLA